MEPQHQRCVLPIRQHSEDIEEMIVRIDRRLWPKLRGALDDPSMTMNVTTPVHHRRVQVATRIADPSTRLLQTDERILRDLLGQRLRISQQEGDTNQPGPLPRIQDLKIATRTAVDTLGDLVHRSHHTMNDVRTRPTVAPTRRNLRGKTDRLRASLAAMIFGESVTMSTAQTVEINGRLTTFGPIPMLA